MMPIVQRSLICRVWLVLAVFASTYVWDAVGREANASPHKALCGPVCVQFILEYFGIHENLVAVAAETAANDVTGSSLANLQRAIERHGLHTYAISINDDLDLRWSGPAIVHFSPAADLGHFVVQLPSDAGGDCSIVDHQGIHNCTPSALAKMRSGAVLLVSDKRISMQQAVSAVARSSPWQARLLFGVAITMIVTAWPMVRIAREKFVRHP